MIIDPEVIFALTTAVDFDDFEVSDLVLALREADSVYTYTGDNLFTDAQYDAMYQFAKTADPKNDYFTTVGSDVRGGKVTLPNAMGSLTQAYNDADLQGWVAKHNLTKGAAFCVTEKLDGMSGSLHFNNKGQLRVAYSRGNGTEGADITRHLKHVIPTRHFGAKAADLEVRCEVIISKANFELVKKLVFRRDGSEYKNPRNMIAGLMNSSEIPDIAYKYIDVVVYHNWNEDPVNKHDQLLKFKQIGLSTPFAVMMTDQSINDQHLTAVLNKMRESSPYEIDGIVIEVNDYHLRQKINPSRATLNPEYARKYKVADASNNAIATVDFIEWRVSKRGYIKPRVHLVPFPLCGVTITHASGFNADFIVTNGIGPGAKVHMTRSGDVIPFITGVAERSNYTVADFDEELTDIGDWKWSKNDKGERVDAILIGDHANIGLKLAEAFFTGISVDGLKAGNLKKMFECGFDTPAKIINATPEALGFAIASQVTADSIYTSLHKQLHNVTLPQFMGATGLFGRGIGQRKIQKLYDSLGTDLLNFGPGAIQQFNVEGFDTKSINKYIHGLPAYKAFYEEVKAHVKFVEPRVVEGGKLNDQVFLFTGFRNKDLKTRIEDEGGQVADSFSGKVTCVIAADPDEQTGKVQKARQKRVRIIGLSDVEELFMFMFM